MSHDYTITLYKWILQEFTADGRADFVTYLGPHLAAFVQPGHHVLDLCCGTGPFSFWLEAQGAKVTAIDFAPHMIERARAEASKRGSTVAFIVADVLAYGLGRERYDLAIFLGNTVSDFPLSKFVQLAGKVHEALKPAGKFIIHYVDGLYPFIQESYPRQAVQQEEPERIVRRFKEYLPEVAAYVETYQNEATGEEYDYTSYVYAPPVVRFAVAHLFDLQHPIQLSAQSFLDVFVKRDASRKNEHAPAS